MRSKSRSRRSRKRRSQTQPEVTATPKGTNLQDFVAGLPDEKKQELVEVLAVSRIETTFSGPLPTPDDFAKYDEVQPGAADRILAMAEREQNIRAEGQAGMFANDRRRIHAGTLVGVALIAVAGVAAWQGNVAIALPLGLVGTITAIIRHITDWLDRRWARHSDR